MDRLVAVAEPIANVIWWLYLALLAFLAYTNRNTLGWDDVQFAVVITLAALAGFGVLMVLLAGAAHAWKLTLILGMLGGFLGQGWVA